MLNVIETGIEGAFLIKNYHFNDSRGVFIKTFDKESIKKKYKKKYVFNEIYYSISKKNVIRGMHFQLPPFDHDKLVSCISGEVLDVIIDLRKSSPSYLVINDQILNSKGVSLLIPKGCAHGFLSLRENSILAYNVSTVFSEKHDSGLLWNSIGYEWPIKNPIISNRDQSLYSLSEFKTPF